MTANRWEYLRVVVHGSTSGEITRGEMAEKANTDWEALLNERGAEGWELVSERVTGEEWSSRSWIEFSGTMKRPTPRRG